MDYRYKSSDGLIDVNALSPNCEFYYIVQKPKTLNPAAFGCKIAFFDKNGKLIYHRTKVYAHELHSKKEIELGRQKMQSGQFSKIEESGAIEIVKWSYEGNFVYFLEYYGWNYEVFYTSVFINLKAQCCYRIDELINDFEIVENLNLKDRQYDEEKVTKILHELEIHPQQPFIDKIFDNFFSRFLFRNKWHPRLISLAQMRKKNIG